MYRKIVSGTVNNEAGLADYNDVLLVPDYLS